MMPTTPTTTTAAATATVAIYGVSANRNSLTVPIEQEGVRPIPLGYPLLIHDGHGHLGSI